MGILSLRLPLLCWIAINVVIEVGGSVTTPWIQRLGAQLEQSDFIRSRMAQSTTYTPAAGQGCSISSFPDISNVVSAIGWGSATCGAWFSLDDGSQFQPCYLTCGQGYYADTTTQYTPTAAWCQSIQSSNTDTCVQQASDWICPGCDLSSNQSALGCKQAGSVCQATSAQCGGIRVPGGVVPKRASYTAPVSPSFGYLTCFRCALPTPVDPTVSTTPFAVWTTADAVPYQAQYGCADGYYGPRTMRSCQSTCSGANSTENNLSPCAVDGGGIWTGVEPTCSKCDLSMYNTSYYSINVVQSTGDAPFAAMIGCASLPGTEIHSACDPVSGAWLPEPASCIPSATPSVAPTISSGPTSSLSQTISVTPSTSPSISFSSTVTRSLMASPSQASSPSVSISQGSSPSTSNSVTSSLASTSSTSVTPSVSGSASASVTSAASHSVSHSATMTGSTSSTSMSTASVSSSPGAPTMSSSSTATQTPSVETSISATSSIIPASNGASIAATVSSSTTATHSASVTLSGSSSPTSTTTRSMSPSSSSSGTASVSSAPTKSVTPTASRSSDARVVILSASIRFNITLFMPMIPASRLLVPLQNTTFQDIFTGYIAVSAAWPCDGVHVRYVYVVQEGFGRRLEGRQLGSERGTVSMYTELTLDAIAESSFANKTATASMLTQRTNDAWSTVKGLFTVGFTVPVALDPFKASICTSLGIRPTSGDCVLAVDSISAFDVQTPSVAAEDGPADTVSEGSNSSFILIGVIVSAFVMIAMAMFAMSIVNKWRRNNERKARASMTGRKIVSQRCLTAEDESFKRSTHRPADSDDDDGLEDFMPPLVKIPSKRDNAVLHAKLWRSNGILHAAQNGNTSPDHNIESKASSHALTAHRQTSARSLHSPAGTGLNLTPRDESPDDSPGLLTGKWPLEHPTSSCSDSDSGPEIPYGKSHRRILPASTSHAEPPHRGALESKHAAPSKSVQHLPARSSITHDNHETHITAAPSLHVATGAYAHKNVGAAFGEVSPDDFASPFAVTVESGGAHTDGNKHSTTTRQASPMDTIVNPLHSSATRHQEKRMVPM